MSKPSLFVGSSTEGLDFARAARSLLAADAEVTLWNEGLFTIGHTFIETLVTALPRFDFALLVLTPDDLVTSRQAESLGPRDNVLFELGLFMGHLGRSRTFILNQSGGAVKIPSDLAGVTTATYEWPRADSSHRSAVGAACDSIREVIRDLGISDAKSAQQIQEMRGRQNSAEARIQAAERRIDRLFAQTMSRSMFDNLRKLATGSFGPFRNSGGLRRELRHLRDIGYVAVRGHIADLPADGDDLSVFVAVTSPGRDFVDFRNRMEAEDASGDA